MSDRLSDLVPRQRRPWRYQAVSLLYACLAGLAATVAMLAAVYAVLHLLPILLKAILI